MPAYKETHTKSNFNQGLKVGNVATFYLTGDTYTDTGWERVPVICKVLGFDYPFIKTDKYTFHYSRYLPVKQLSLFN